MSADTRDVFIEVTATDLTKAQIVLATLTAMFSEHCATPFEVEPVEVVDALGESHGPCPCITAHLSSVSACITMQGALCCCVT